MHRQIWDTTAGRTLHKLQTQLFTISVLIPSQTIRKKKDMLATAILVLAAVASGVSAQPLSADELGFVPKSWPEIGIAEPAPAKRSVLLVGETHIS